MKLKLAKYFYYEKKFSHKICLSYKNKVVEIWKRINHIHFKIGGFLQEKQMKAKLSKGITCLQ